MKNLNDCILFCYKKNPEQFKQIFQIILFWFEIVLP